MAIKKVQIIPPNYTDIIHPETQADITKYNNSNSELVATNVQSAIDEIDTKTEENKTDILSAKTTLGDVAITTTAQTVTGAINELDADIGNKSTLITTDKSNLVNAVNENRTQINDLGAEVDEATSEAIANTIVKRDENSNIKLDKPRSVNSAMNISDRVKGVYTSEQTEVSNITVGYSYKYLLFIWLGVSSVLSTSGVYIISRDKGTTDFTITPIVELSDVSVSVDEDFKINVANISGSNRSIAFTLIGLGE